MYQQPSNSEGEDSWKLMLCVAFKVLLNALNPLTLKCVVYVVYVAPDNRKSY